MIRAALLWLVVFILPTVAFAQPKENANETYLILVLGNMKTVFDITNSDFSVMKRSQNQGPTEEFKVASTNAAYLKEEFKKAIALKSKAEQTCPRNFVSVTEGKKTVSACLNIKNAAGKQLAELTNTFETAYRTRSRPEAKKK